MRPLLPLLLALPLLPACEGIQKQPGLLDLVIAQPSVDLRVITLSGSADTAALTAEMHTQAPDLACITDLPHAQLLALLDAAPDFDAVGAPSIDGEVDGKTNAILFRRDKLTASSVRTFWLSSSPSRAGSRSWGQTEPRTCTTAIFTAREGNRSVRVFTTALDPTSHEARVESANLIRRAMFDTGQIGVPVLIAGDLGEPSGYGSSGVAHAILDGEGSRADLLDAVHASRALAPADAPLPTERRFVILTDRSINVVSGTGGVAGSSGAAVTARLGK